MKDFIAKLKSAGFKQLAIDHGEKLVAGLIGLLLLFALWGSNWASYGRTPEELTQKVQSARDAIARGNWANSADAKNGLYTPAAGLQKEQVVQLLTDNSDLRNAIVEEQRVKYQYSTPLVSPLYRRSEPAAQPDALAVEELLATPGNAVIPQTTVVAMSDGPVSGQPAEDNDPGRRRVKGANNGAGPGALPGGPGGPAAAAFPGQPGMGPGRGPGLGSGMGSGLTTAKGLRYVAVRGIVPLFRQIERISDALNLTHRQAAMLVDYWDFRLERRSKPLSGDADFGEWEQVDIRTAMEVLRDSAGWDPELIELSLTDPVLTMSLPTRQLYEWHKSEVSHPKVDNYVLTPSQRDRQMDIYEGFLDQQIEEAGAIRDQEKGGMSAMQQGNRQLGPQMAAGPTGMRSQSTQNIVNKIAESLNSSDPERVKQELLEQIMKNQTASGRLLLFRYLDFDVKPGTTYQYRVQLQMANPNYERPEHLVLDPEFTKERFLTTPFSQPTAPVSVPATVDYYVTRVDEENGANPPSATFDVYQWSTEYGSTINQKLKVLFGSFVGDRTETEVVDVARTTYFDKAEVEFNSDDVLVDVFDAPKSIDLDEHEDLKDLPSDTLRRGLGVSEQALLVNEFGELVAYDPVSLSDRHTAREKRLKREREDQSGIIESGAAAGDPMGADFLEYEDQFRQGGSPDAAVRGKSRRNKKSLRRRGNRRGAGPPMPGY